MSLQTATHTPEHIAALFAVATARAKAQHATGNTTNIVLCSSLPETLETDTQYLVLCRENIRHPQATHVQAPISLYALTQKIIALLSANQHVKALSHHWKIDLQTREMIPVTTAENAASPALRLTEIETKLIAYLLDQETKSAPREQLVKAVWGYGETIETHTLETHLYRLRQKLESGSPMPCQITAEDGNITLITST